MAQEALRRQACRLRLRPLRAAGGPRLAVLLLAGGALRGLLPAAFAPAAWKLQAAHRVPWLAAAGRGSRVPRGSRGGESSEALAVGDKVQAVSPHDRQRYPGEVEGVNADGTYTVRWDEPGTGPETDDIEAGEVTKVVVFKDYVAGDDVKAIFPEDGGWYPGSVAEVNADGTFKVKWDDPDLGERTSNVKPEEMQKVTVFRSYKVDEKVEAIFPEDGQMYPCTVIARNEDGTFQVMWDFWGAEASTVSPKDMRRPRIPVESLKVGQKFMGTVRSVCDFGGFVDIGATVDGLVHSSRISAQRVQNVHDWLREGQEVVVWVSEVRRSGKLGLTMVEGVVGHGRAPKPKEDLSPFAKVSPDDFVDGVVERIAPFGAFVRATLPGGASALGLVHVSQVKEGFIDKVEYELEVGQEVRVRVISVDVAGQKLGLSMKRGAKAPVDLTAFKGRDPDEWLTGIVERTAPFGVVVTVTAEDGAEATGLVHIKQIRDGFVESIDDEVKAGQEVSVRVLSVDSEKGSLRLTMLPVRD